MIIGNYVLSLCVLNREFPCICIYIYIFVEEISIGGPAFGGRVHFSCFIVKIGQEKNPPKRWVFHVSKFLLHSLVCLFQP